MNIGSSKSIWGMEVDLMGRRSHLRFLEGVGVVQYRGVIKQKYSDFRSPEVGISANSLCLEGEATKLMNFN